MCIARCTSAGSAIGGSKRSRSIACSTPVGSVYELSGIVSELVATPDEVADIMSRPDVVSAIET